MVQGKLAADLAIAQAPDGPRARSVVVVDDGEPYGIGLADAFIAQFQSRGGTLLDRELTLPNASMDLHGLAYKIASFHPAAVFYGGVVSEGGAGIKKFLVEAGFTGPM